MTRIRSRYRRTFYGHGIADPMSAPEISADRITHVHPDDLDEFLRRHGAKATITFDDGYADNLTVALPILEKYDKPATVFVTSGFVERSEPLLARVAGAVARSDDWSRPSVVDWLETPPSAPRDFYQLLHDALKALTVAERRSRQAALMADYDISIAELTADYLSVEQLVELDAHPLITIGAHTVSHPDLRRTTDAELEYELVAGRRRLEQWLGHTVDTLAYPFGDTDVRVRRATAAAGYRRAYTTARDDWLSEVPFLRPLDRPRRDLAWEVFRMRERDRKQAARSGD
ncbi:hypothetical protein S4A8_10456 [Salinisphaera sp. S4-8]|uniref:polysaccharide deacetylase family protein n=1 Tax=Salinisphaera sp. S4-8 TaxID=633357 RepID=UPI00334085A1